MKKKLVAISLLLATVLVGGAWAGWVTQESGTTNNLNAMFFVDNNMGFAAGAGGTIRRTVNGGSTWTAATSGTVQNLNDVVFPVTLEGYGLAATGDVVKSTDQGSNFSPIAMPVAVAGGNFKKGTFSGVNRSLAVNMGASTDSYLVNSSDSGGSWSETAQTNLEIEGVSLSGGATWVWGKYYAGADAGDYVILKDGTKVWEGTTPIRDLMMINSNIGFAVGDSGLVLETTAGGDSGDWGTVSTSTVGLTANLNSLFFFIVDSTIFGWVVGDSGAVSFTADGGTHWSTYEVEGNPNINDIYVRHIGGGAVFAYLCCDGGKIFKLTSPTITTVTPGTQQQGFLGTVEVTGSGFMSGAAVTFQKAGQVDPDPDIIVLSTDFLSESKVQARVLISAEAAVGLRDVSVTNPDATTSTEASSFSVATSEVDVRNLWLDGNKVLTTETSTITPSPRVSFEVYSLYGVSAGNVNAQIVTKHNSAYNFYTVPASGITAVGTQTVIVSYDVASAFSAGQVVDIFLFAQDDAGNVGGMSATVQVATTEAPAGRIPPPGSRTGIGAVYPIRTTVDFVNEPAQLQLRILPGMEVNNPRVILTDWRGMRVWERTFNTTIVEKFNFEIQRSELPPHLTTGMYTVLFFDESGALIAKNRLMVVPSSMR